VAGVVGIILALMEKRTDVSRVEIIKFFMTACPATEELPRALAGGFLFSDLTGFLKPVRSNSC
jgi:hypothetical protein